MNKDVLGFHPVKSPLARRLIVAVVLFSAAITVLMTALQLRQERQRSMAGIERQLEQVAAVHLPSLSQSLWATNTNEIQLQLEGMTREPNIVYAAIHENGRPSAQAGSRDAANLVERRFPVRHEYRGELRELGTLRVAISLDNIERELRQEAIGVLASNALRIFLVAIFIFLLFHRLVTRHLANIAEQMGAADPTSQLLPLKLTRRRGLSPDELDVLVKSANDMQSKASAALNALRDSEERVRLLLDSTAEAIYGVDTQGVCTFANPACVRMLGYVSEADLAGRHIHGLTHHSHADGRPFPVKECTIHIAATEGRPGHSRDEVFWRADGSSFPVEYWAHPIRKAEKLVGAVVTFMDISEEKRAEAELHRLAYYDTLTGLPNRVLFNDRLHHALANARRHNRFVALMLLDLDHFKRINDTMGHEAGDSLLREIGWRLQQGVREGDTVSRLGGDEFALVFPDIGEIQHVVQLAQNVRSQFATPVTINGREIFCEASIGVALYPADTEDADSLLRFADSAMYHAKESGRNNFQFYSSEMTASVQARLQLETDLRRALEKNEFFLNYQPQVDAQNRRVTGIEALLRWRDAAGKPVSPARFIPLAEDTGLIVPIGKWVLETACMQLKRWHDAGHGGLIVSVNVASRQFRDPQFPDMVRQAIAAACIPPQSLELEITESILLEHSDDTLHTLYELKTIGVTLAIDDFGTGYSSLGYLKRFPIDRLKIDQSFVRDIVSDAEDLAIVRAVIVMARALHLGVIAEGVETGAQLALLLREGCHDCQGYYFSRPLDADAFTQWLRATSASS